MMVSVLCCTMNNLWFDDNLNHLMVCRFLNYHNFIINTTILWNTCFGTLLDPPIPSTVLQSGNPLVIIPGSNMNSDLTISFETFKTQLKD